MGHRANFRPSHADFTYEAKYGSETGRAAVELPRAKRSVGSPRARWRGKFFRKCFSDFEIVAYVAEVHEIIAGIDRSSVKLGQVEKNVVRCPDEEAATRMIKLIEQTRAEGDSLGGVIECVVRGVTPGLGEPVFDKLEADLAKAMLSLPATKGFEIGSGFAATKMKGSEHNDAFEMRDERVRTKTNRSGGVQGGISNGEDIVFRVAFKPTATIARAQQTVTAAGEEIMLAAGGRHDPCVLPRAVPMVEAMAVLVLCDHALRQRAINWPNK